MKKKYCWLILLILTVIITFCHSPGIFIYKNLPIEDGPIFFQQAQDFGIKSLLIPYAGYYHTILRLIAYFASLMPKVIAPVIYLFFIVFIQYITVLFTYKVFKLEDVKYGLIIALIPLLAPVEPDVYDNLTNMQWHLGYLLALLAVYDWRKINNYVLIPVLFLLALTGPFAVFLIPVIIARMIICKDRILPYIFYFAGVICQIKCLLLSDRMMSEPLMLYKIKMFLYNFIGCFSNIDLFSCIIAILFLYALYKMFKDYKQNLPLLSVLYLGVVVLCFSILVLLSRNEGFIPGRYLYIYCTGVLLSVILTFKNKIVTFAVILFILTSFSYIYRKNIFWDEHVKFLKFQKEVCVTTDYFFYFKLRNNQAELKNPDFTFRGVEYFNPSDYCSGKSVGITAPYEEETALLIVDKKEKFSDKIYVKPIGENGYGFHYILPADDNEYRIIIKPKNKISGYCLD